MAKGASARFPLCLIPMELGAQLEARGSRLSTAWAPREQNQAADDLTNLKFDRKELCPEIKFFDEKESSSTAQIDPEDARREDLLE